MRYRCLGLDGYLLSQWVFPALEYELNPLQIGIELLAGLSAQCGRVHIDIVVMDGLNSFKSIASEDCILQERAWTPIALCGSPGLLLMSAADKLHYRCVRAADPL